MFKGLTEFFLMMMGISSTDEEIKQQRERDRWARQRELAEREEHRDRSSEAPDDDEDVSER